MVLSRMVARRGLYFGHAVLERTRFAHTKRIEEEDIIALAYAICRVQYINYVIRNHFNRKTS